MPWTEKVLATYNVKLFGEGTQPLMFAHGLACDQNVWQYVSKQFQKDYKIILFDFIGSGNSDLTAYNKEKYASLNGYADDVLQICEALDLKNVIFVGHSVSAMIGMLAAIKNPAIFSRLIMIGPSACYLNEPKYRGGFNKEDILQLLVLMKENYVKWSSYFSPIVMGNQDKPELTEQLNQIFCQADPDITCDFAHTTFLSDNREDLKKVTTPTLIMQLNEDVVAPVHVGEYIHKNLPGSIIYYMKATGHFPHLSAVQETISMIKMYLKNY